jgi:hypothetical protein
MKSQSSVGYGKTQKHLQQPSYQKLHSGSSRLECFLPAHEFLFASIPLSQSKAQYKGLADVVCFLDRLSLCREGMVVVDTSMRQRY